MNSLVTRRFSEIYDSMQEARKKKEMQAVEQSKKIDLDWKEQGKNVEWDWKEQGTPGRHMK